MTYLAPSIEILLFNNPLPTCTIQLLWLAHVITPIILGTVSGMGVQGAHRLARTHVTILAIDANLDREMLPWYIFAGEQCSVLS